MRRLSNANLTVGDEGSLRRPTRRSAAASREPPGSLFMSRQATPLAIVFKVILGIGTAGLAAMPGAAEAYSFYSPLTAGCHEKITSEALRAVRLELTTAAPLDADRNDRALIKDLQFTPDDDMKDLGAATLL